MMTMAVTIVERKPFFRYCEEEQSRKNKRQVPLLNWGIEADILSFFKGSKWNRPTNYVQLHITGDQNIVKLYPTLDTLKLYKE